MDNKKRIEISEEVLAVIFAAIASISEKPGCKLVERPIRRVPQTSTKWSSAGRIERLRSNLNTQS